MFIRIKDEISNLHKVETTKVGKDRITFAIEDGGVNFYCKKGATLNTTVNILLSEEELNVLRKHLGNRSDIAYVL